MSMLDHPHLRELARVSRIVGRDVTLVQGAGGNSSTKLDGVLWVKASGTWLADAEARRIFVPVDLRVALQAITDNQEKIPALAHPDADPTLRPSIETSLHALIPHRCVLHVHGVNSIAWAVMEGAEAEMATRLAGLEWAYLPYCRPGVPLSQALAQLVRRDRPDVLILGNHGLVVGADDMDRAEALIREVERRLALAPRPAGAADPDRLAKLAEGSLYRPAEFAECHRAALDPWSLDLAAGGSLYPDHVVFLGSGALALAEGDSPAAIEARAAAHDLPAPPIILVPGAGCLIRGDLPAGAEAITRCLGLVAERIPEGTAVRYLAADEEAALMDWDAERYRKSLQMA
jgi:rhamnose utilization protein RhaD (predicted bifunctional aldolase and dehydrogenase)